MRKPIEKNHPAKGQVSIEYVLLLGGILVFVGLLIWFMQDTILNPQTQDIQEKNQKFRDLSKQLETLATPIPSGSSTLVSTAQP
ncbi:MAG TPA: class III signal peptide-containing protein [Candidatus Norongarragalinales archaeon]|nr:class III signal peptide-containing protein [Candidatus Norongarragalinales archaeon]